MADKYPRATELKELPVDELNTQIKTIRQDLWNARIKVQNGSMQQVNTLKQMRRQIARIETVITAKTSDASVENSSENS